MVILQQSKMRFELNTLKLKYSTTAKILYLTIIINILWWIIDGVDNLSSIYPFIFELIDGVESLSFYQLINLFLFNNLSQLLLRLKSL